MPNLLSNIKILLLLPNILIRLEVSRLTDNITKINSNLIGRFIFCQYWSQLILTNLIFTVTQAQKMLFGRNPLLSSALMPKPDKK